MELLGRILAEFIVLQIFRQFTVAFCSLLTGIPANQQGDFKKRLMKYCAYAWGTPAIVVLICVTVDHVKKGIIGYGECSGTFKCLFPRRWSEKLGIEPLRGSLARFCSTRPPRKAASIVLNFHSVIVEVR